MVTPRDPRRHKRSAPALVPAWMFHQSGVIYSALIETLHTATPGAAVHSKHVRVRRNGSHRSWSATVAMPAMAHFSSPSELGRLRRARRSSRCPPIRDCADSHCPLVKTRAIVRRDRRRQPTRCCRSPHIARGRQRRSPGHACALQSAGNRQAKAFKARSFRAIELVRPLRYTGSRPLAGEMGRSGAIRPVIANTSAAVARTA
jgi:hypothetical protein